MRLAGSSHHVLQMLATSRTYGCPSLLQQCRVRPLQRSHLELPQCQLSLPKLSRLVLLSVPARTFDYAQYICI